MCLPDLHETEQGRRSLLSVSARSPDKLRLYAVKLREQRESDKTARAREYRLHSFYGS
jgi:hypothetical protein